MLQPNHRAWVEIDPGAIAANVRACKEFLGKSTALMAVVKADAYGHGAMNVAAATIEGGATWLGVATIDEGIELRQNGITVPILVLGATTTPGEVQALLDYHLQPTVSNLEEAELCHQAARGRKIPVHLKLDTGMSRLGKDWRQGSIFIEAVQGLSALEVRGIYSHLATADEADPAFVKVQQGRFHQIVSQYQKEVPYIHLCNTGGMLLDRSLHYDMVRIGLGIYGYAPAPHLEGRVTLQPALVVKARLSQIKTVPPETGISYGHRFITSRESRIGVVTIGYADGLPRGLSNQVQFRLKDYLVPQIGTITMDQCMVDLTDLPQARVGDILEIMNDARDWATKLQTIPWEILCGFKHRLPRLTCQSNKKNSPTSLKLKNNYEYIYDGTLTFGR